MTKILGLDLGTNSIGWAIREKDDFYENQIRDAGVTIFKKGVGDGKNGEYSLAAERRSNRSKRRLYNAKRYRKWATLKLLVENNMCPLSMEELNLWRIGSWANINGKAKNTGRIFPMSINFLNWIRMDFNSDGKGDYLSPYELRIELTDKYDKSDKHRLYKIGRAIYHLTQRRGFKTSRKSGKSKYGENEYFKKFYESNPDKTDWTASKIWMYLLSQADDDNKLRITRIRNSGIIPRSEFEKEFKAICNKQKINEELTTKLGNAIYYVRPLRTQKGLVGKCTFEKNKSRIPISHPFFEEFRALQFINNIKWKNTELKSDFEFIPVDVKRNIFKNLFFRKSAPYFKFEEIIKRFSENGKYEFNYKNNPTISACPVITGIIKTFSIEWKDIFIEKEDEYGINWNSLSLQYNTSQYNKPKNVKLDVDGIWHILFDSLQTKDDENGLSQFLMTKLGWEEEQIKSFTGIDINQGYAALSKNAILKIMLHLRSGMIYTEAVFLANIKKVIKNNFEGNIISIIKKDIEDLLIKNREENDKINILNSLVQKYFANREYANNEIVTKQGNEPLIEEKIKTYLGDKYYNDLNGKKKNEYEEYIAKKYHDFINGNQEDSDKATSKNNGQIPKFDYFRIPRLDEKIGGLLVEKYGATKISLKHLYHPSDIDIYPKASEKTISANGINIKIKQLGNPQPQSKGFKNPMAMRTMYELRKLINYLLIIGKIDEETKIVLEISRELNDRNYRKAYLDWTTDKEQENNGARNAIQEILGITGEPSNDNYKKFICATEQISEFHFSDNISEGFYEKLENFKNTYLAVKGNKGDTHDYISYLILTREEFAKMLNYSPPNSNKWVTQIITTSKQFRDKRKELREMLTRYRLWKEQKFHCFYTGKIIPLNKLFTSDYQLEHTIPRSISFDSELKNMTVCDSVYNNQIKGNKFPSECPNYETEFICNTAEGNINCPPIINSIDKLVRPKVKELEKRIIELRHISKGIPDWETDRKDANIRLRHYLNFELEYWKEKLFTFEVKKNEWKDKFKNSQMIDTQIISKYAKSYLKTLFSRVDVQKGSITAVFREIYGLPEKTRINHLHHAFDAAVLTLVPGSATRDKIMENYFRYKENKLNDFVTPLPYDTFHVSHLKDEIEKKVLVNHVVKDQTLTITKKYARKRGKIEYIRSKKDGNLLYDKNGNKKPKIMQGDSIRGQLHKESFFGAIKVNVRDENGFPQRGENGDYIILKDESGNETLWFVKRINITNLEIINNNGKKIIKDYIIDPFVKRRIEYCINNGESINNIFSDNERKHKIRHVRCRVPAGRGFLTRDKALEIKKHTYVSKFKHKQSYYTQNSDNYAYLLYEGFKNNKIKRGYRILNYFDIINIGLRNLNNIFSEPYFQILETGNGKNKSELRFKALIKRGNRIILYKDNPEVIKDFSVNEIRNCLYVVYKFNEVNSTGYIYAQHHAESRENDKLGDGDIKFEPSIYQPRLKLRPDECNFLIEGVDFNITLDGKIEFIFMKND